MQGEFRRGGLVGPIVLIGLGIVFLLENLGFISISLWEVVLRTWPILLIAWGVDLLIIRRTAEATAFTLILLLVIIGGGLWIFGIQGDSFSEAKIEHISLPAGSATAYEINLAPGIGLVRLAPANDSEFLAVGDVGLSRGQSISVTTDETGKPSSISVGTSGRWFWPAFGRNLETDGVRENEWRLGINATLPATLGIDLGIGEVDLDLEEIRLEGLNVELGIGRLVVFLPAGGVFDVKLSAAIGLIEVYVPRDLALEIKLDTALSVTDLDGFRREGNVYFSPAAKGSRRLALLEITQVIGIIKIHLQ